MSGNSRDGGHSNAAILEYATPNGEVIARKVENARSLDPAPAEVVVVDRGTAPGATAQVAEASARVIAP